MDNLGGLIVNRPCLSRLNPYYYYSFKDCAEFQRYQSQEEIFHEGNERETEDSYRRDAENRGGGVKGPN